MKVFLTHASEQAEIAESIAVALSAEGHSVFLDRSSLPSGEGYNDRIRDAIAESDLFVFLVSPESVAKGRYSITELEFAERKWSNPDGHVMPVIVKPTELSAIPVYLRAVTFLEPRGNVAAGVASAVEAIRPRRWASVKLWVAVAVLAAILAGTGAWWALQRRALDHEVASLLASGEQQRQLNRYQAAWDVYTRATDLSSNRLDAVRGQERLAMDWIEHAHAIDGKSTFSDLVDKLDPVLTRCAASNDPRRSADCLAHLGWGDFLRSRDGAVAANPAAQYKHALERDPTNAYAHALLGFDILRTGGSLPEAKQHFAAAIQHAGREREYIRHVQIAALLYRHDPALEIELIRLANQLRLTNEAIPADEGQSDTPRFWSIYTTRLITAYETAPFLDAVPPPDHLATFVWLFPESDIAPDRRLHYLYMRAALEEHAGQRDKALSAYKNLREQFAKDGSLKAGGSLIDRTLAGIKRLSR